MRAALRDLYRRPAVRWFADWIMPLVAWFAIWGGLQFLFTRDAP